MSNTKELESINSVCTTSEELIKSEDFIKGITIILEKVKTFNKDYILSLFTKLQCSEVLEDEEREDLKSFMSYSKVARLGQELLSKLNNISVNVKTNNRDELSSFSNLLDEIFSEDGFKKVQGYVGEVANITELTLNTYEGFSKVSIEVNGETKEIYLENENLKVDSSEWKEKEIGGVKVKINNEGDITEYLEGELAGEQLFTWDAAMRESEKQGKRLPKYLDEFQAIIDKVGPGEFMKKFPGSRYTDGSDFGNKGKHASFWGASLVGDDAINMEFCRGNSKALRTWDSKAYGLSVRCIKY